MKYKVALVDDHHLLRIALMGLINKMDGFEVNLEASNGLELFEKLQHCVNPDILILDLNMPKLDGFDTAKLLNEKYPEIKVVTLTMYDSEAALIKLLRAGIRGFLKKDIHPSELNHALKMIVELGYYYTNSSANKLASLFRLNSMEFFNKVMLSDEEITFLQLTATDQTYKEISIAMGISLRSVYHIRDQLFEKLDVKSRVGLALFAIKNGLVHF